MTKITIAGYGSVGHYVAKIFDDYNPVIYDPPLGYNEPNDLIDTDFVIVCVPTARLLSGACDTSIVEEIVRLADPNDAIICHSTISVGTTDRLIKETGKPLVFMPEYAGESEIHPLSNPDHPEFLIYGGYGPAVSKVQSLYENVYTNNNIQHFPTEPKTAEIVKYMENAFLATKVAFCNEFYDLCEATDVDYEEVKSLWLQDNRINQSHTIVTKERGFGGQCLPKDLAAICNTARNIGSPMHILEAVEEANNHHRQKAQGKI